MHYRFFKPVLTGQTTSRGAENEDLAVYLLRKMQCLFLGLGFLFWLLIDQCLLSNKSLSDLLTSSPATVPPITRGPCAGRHCTARPSGGARPRTAAAARSTAPRRALSPAAHAENGT